MWFHIPSSLCPQCGLFTVIGSFQWRGSLLHHQLFSALCPRLTCSSHLGLPPSRLSSPQTLVLWWTQLRIGLQARAKGSLCTWGTSWGAVSPTASLVQANMITRPDPLPWYTHSPTTDTCLKILVVWSGTLSPEIIYLRSETSRYRAEVFCRKLFLTPSVSLISSFPVECKWVVRWSGGPRSGYRAGTCRRYSPWAQHLRDVKTTQ